MFSTLRAHSLTWVLGFLWLGLGLSVWRWAGEQSVVSQLEGVSPWPSTDWVAWQVENNRLTVAHVLQPGLRDGVIGTALSPGDQLLAIDRQPVQQPGLLDELHNRALPGDVRLYTYLPAREPGTTRTVLGMLTYRPVCLPIQNAVVWYAGYALCILGVVCSVIFLVVAWPLLQSNRVRRVGQLVRLAILLVCLYSIGTLRYTWASLQLNPDSYALDAFLTMSQLVCSATLGVGLAALRDDISRAHRWAIRLTGLILGLGAFGVYIFRLNWVIFEAHLAWLYTFWLLLAALPHLQIFRLGHLKKFRTEVALGLLAWGLGLYLGSYGVFQVPAPALAVLAGLWVVPVLQLGWHAQGTLQVGNWYQALTQFGALLIGGLGLFFITLQVQRYLIAAGWPEPLPAGSALLVFTGVVGGLIFVYRHYEARLRPVFQTRSQERLEALNQFIDSIPRYTQSQKLIEAVQQNLSQVLGVPHCRLWLSTETTDTDDPQWEELHQALTQAQTFWSRNALFAAPKLPSALAHYLSLSHWMLAFPFTVSPHQRGLLLLGNRQKGVYTLQDVELIRRLVLQSRLTLEILYLLEREKRLASENIEARLKALRSQINPHFLFNTLNSISDLIHTSPGQAEEAIVKLAFIFRYTLERSEESLVPLSDELALIQTYLELEKIRFGDRLTYTIDLPRDCRTTSVPAFVLQTVVENCVKHGISKRLSGGVVSITVWREAAGVRCRLYDNGPGIQLDRIVRGTGLRNIISRVSDTYQRTDLLRFERVETGTVVELLIPYQSTSYPGISPEN
jgi:hypothetical protein